MLARLAITTGEPAGIGPELLVQYSQVPNDDFELVAIGAPDLLTQTARQLNLPLKLHPFDPHKPKASQPGSISIVPVALSSPVCMGQLNSNNAAYVLNTLTSATTLCMQQQCDAVCTLPVHKGVINDAGIAFSGHTEFFAAQSNTDKVVMMLETKGLRVALATTHIPLKDVANHIQTHSLKQCIQILHTHLQQYYALENPCILVAGLNPHAGENGHLGDEEIKVINPVIKHFQAKQWNVHGSFPADTLFTPPYIKQADAFLAMYHDQGLPVLKHAGFHHAANITLGLPFIRTSVDHGTALDLVGTGKANISSFETAIAAALSMINKGRI